MTQQPPSPQKARRITPTPTLYVPEGALAGTMIRLDQDVATIGRRHDNTYVLEDPHVSRVHAEVRKEAGSIIVTDLGSAGGTRVNDVAVTTAVLTHGDTISFGSVTARFEDQVTAADPDDTTEVLAVPAVETGPSLSPRQQQVLERMAEGMTNSEIGDQLGVTERTIKAYAQELYDRLGVRNRAGAVAEGIRAGLL